MEDRITIEIIDHVADVKLNRPDKLNALDEAMFAAIIDTATQLNHNADVRAVVLSGSGKGFCAGIDITSFDLSGEGGLGQQDLATRTHGIANKWQKAAYAWRELSVPVIAAVHGICYGGGLQIMSGADIKYVSKDARLSIMEGRWGIIPDMSGSQLMRHNVRDDILRELTYTYRIFSGEEAVTYGFATHTAEDPYVAAMQLAKEIASNNPTSIVNAKQLYNQANYLNDTDGLQLESELQSKTMSHPNQMESVYAAMQKRKGDYKNYRSEG